MNNDTLMSDREELAKEFESLKDNQAFRMTNLARRLVVDSLRNKFTCVARPRGSNQTAGGNDPQECDWPICGCDPHADKVIAALQESGHLQNPDTKV